MAQPFVARERRPREERFMEMDLSIDWRTLLTSEAFWYPVGIVGLLYVGAPALVYGTLALNARPTLEPRVIRTLPPAAAAYFAETAPGFAACGFRVAAHVHIADMMRGQQSTVTLWLHDAAGQQATAVVMGNGKRYCEFMTKFSRGPAVLTNNSNDLGGFKRVRTKDTAAAPWLDDLADLYRLHLYREILFTPTDPTRYLPAKGHELASFMDGLEFDLERQVHAGYFRRGRTPNEYRPSLVGAFMMTWKELPPMKQIRRPRVHRRVRAQEDAARTAGLVKAPANVRISNQSPYRMSEAALAV
jgi:hypothetical protein